MRVLLLAAWAVLIAGSLMTPCRAEPDASGASKTPVKERLNSLSPGEAARAARSRARASASTHDTAAAQAQPQTHSDVKVTSHEPKRPRVARTETTKRRHVAIAKPYRIDRTPDRRRYVQAPRVPRVGDVVPDNVSLYSIPRHYAYQPPYPSPYDMPRRRPLGFFFFPRGEEADDGY